MNFWDLFKFKKDSDTDIKLLQNPILTKEEKATIVDYTNLSTKLGISPKDSMSLPEMSEQKAIDWNLMQSLQNSTSDTGFFRQEYNIFVDKTILKNVYANETNVFKAISFISKQFLSTRFQLKQRLGTGKEKIIDTHPLLDLLNNPRDESRAVFYSTGIIDLITTGEFYFYYNKNEKSLVRIPSEKVRITNNPTSQNDVQYEVISYVNGKQYSVKYDSTELIQAKLANPYYKFSGLSDIVAALLPILIDKYSKEYVVGFFLRGGQLPLILESDTNAFDTLLRIFKSLQHAFAGRRNTHSDKILPKGLTYKAEGGTFKSLQLLDLLKANQRDVLGQLGVPPAIVGDTDGVNYANAEEQMKGFWKNRILPLQKLICSTLEQSYLWQAFGLDSSKFELIFDNSQNEYLSLFGEHIDQNLQVIQYLTVNELRARIGYPPIADGDVLLTPPKPKIDPNQMNSFDALNQANGQNANSSKNLKKKLIHEKARREVRQAQKIPKQIKSLYKDEFKEWESIVIAHPKDKSEATKKIHARGKHFSEKVAADIRPYAVKLYNAQMNHVLRTKSNFSMLTKENARDRKTRLEFLKNRAAAVMQGEILDRSESSFVGYSDTQMERVYNMVDDLLAQGMGMDEIASNIRDKFGEFYEGQADTIIRTEFLSSQSIAFKTFEDDLKTVASSMTKTWLSIMDDRTREDHADVNEEKVDFTSEDDDTTFSIGLAYPRDPNGDASEVINCRCTMVTKVNEWQE